MIGIYKITSPSKRVYIGQSIHIEKRFNDYRFISNSRAQIKLYNSFKKYGINNHVFEIVCECETWELNEKERYYQDLYSVMANGLNCMLTKSNDRSGKLSIETRLKMIGKENTAEHFKKIILDNVTGIFYLGAKEAALVYGLNHGTLVSRLNGRLPNNTNLIYV